MNNGNFITWTVINKRTLLKHLPLSIETSLGHLDQELKNLQAMKPVNFKFEIEGAKDFIQSWIVQRHTKYVRQSYCSTPMKMLQGPFKSLTSQINQWKLYVMVVYDYDSNAILAKPIKKCMEKLSVMPFSKCTRYQSQ